MPRSGSSRPHSSIIPDAGSTRWLKRIERCWRAKRPSPPSSVTRRDSSRTRRANSSGADRDANSTSPSMRLASSARPSPSRSRNAAPAASACSPLIAPSVNAPPSLGVSFSVSLRRAAFRAARFDVRPASARSFSGNTDFAAISRAMVTSAPSHHRRVRATFAAAAFSSGRGVEASSAATASQASTRSFGPTHTSQDARTRQQRSGEVRTLYEGVWHSRTLAMRRRRWA